MATPTASATPSAPLHVETLAQLYTRISAGQRPQLDPHRVAPRLFGDDHCSASPSLARQTIEITGESNVGKTHMLMELMAGCVLPPQCGGHDANVLFIDTEHQFQIHRFCAVLEKFVEAHFDSDDTNRSAKIQTIIDESLGRLHIWSCHSPEQLELAVADVDHECRQNTRIAMLALDSVATYYWMFDFSLLPAGTPATAAIRMDTHVRRLVGQFAGVTAKHGVALAYIRPAGFRSNKSQAMAEDGADVAVGGGEFVAPAKRPPLDWAIVLDECGVDGGAGDQLFRATTERWKGGESDSEVVSRCRYKIDCFGVRWVKAG